MNDRWEGPRRILYLSDWMYSISGSATSRQGDCLMISGTSVLSNAGHQPHQMVGHPTANYEIGGVIM
jgi:hypothetical protein